MIQLFEQLRAAEKNLDNLRRRLDESQHELCDERKRNIVLSQQICASYDRERSLKSDLTTYRAGFWALALLGVGYIFLVALGI